MNLTASQTARYDQVTATCDDELDLLAQQIEALLWARGDESAGLSMSWHLTLHKTKPQLVWLLVRALGRLAASK